MEIGGALCAICWYGGLIMGGMSAPAVYCVKASDPPRACSVCDQPFAPGDQVVLKAVTSQSKLWAHVGCAHAVMPPAGVQ